MSTILITGGSRGIGAAAVRLFAGRGDRVYFLYEKNHEAARAVAEQTGATAVCCDVADTGAVKAAFESLPALDILICNAGIVHYGLMSMMEEAAWNRIFDVNVKGIYNCVNAAMPHFLKKHTGSIVTVSSMWGQVGASCEAAYSATGVILTDMCANIDPETMASLAEESALGRNGTPEDVAKAIAYLADAEFVTGQVLGVNGGLVI